MPAAVAGPVKRTRYHPIEPGKADGFVLASATCGIVTGSQPRPRRPPCQLSVSPSLPGSGAKFQPCASMTGPGGAAAGAACGSTSASATTASTAERRRTTTWAT